MVRAVKRFRAVGACIGVAALAIALTGCTRDDLPSTSFGFSSQAGDYVGQGTVQRYQPASGYSVTVTGTSADLTLNVSGNDSSGVYHFWFAEIAAPRGQTLHPGTYLNAERASFRSGTAPGLDIRGDGRGCNTVTGQFNVYQLATDSSGNVTQLDADATQHCEGATPSLSAELRYNASPMSFTLKSDAADFVGQGVNKVYDGSTSTFSFAGKIAGGNVIYRVSGLTDSWETVIAPPIGTQFTKGASYTTSRSGDATHAELDFSGDGRGCNTSSGTLTINNIASNASGDITALNATFVQHCEGATPAAQGTIRYNA